ncbi:MAG: N-acetyltransferase [Solirubrobacteraceae bacterium]|nr:N-acetyltransferase [Solirubrobacteraceae bacterium]
MAVELTDNTKQRRFEVLVDGELAALVTYGRNAQQMALTHTETEPGFEGQGYAKQVVEFALAHAREAGLDVLPFCPYVRDYIAKHPEQLDLVPAEARPKFELAEA